MTAPQRRGAAASVRAVARWALSLLLTAAGVGHLTVLRRGFRIAVPDWTTRLLRTDKDTVVVVSGVVEAVLGVALVALPRERRRVGLAVAALFVAVFPGNIHHWRTGRDVPGLDSDAKRFARLFLQPLLVAWAVWSTRGEASPGRRRGPAR